MTINQGRSFNFFVNDKEHFSNEQVILAMDILTATESNFFGRVYYKNENGEKVYVSHLQEIDLATTVHLFYIDPPVL